MPATVFDKPIFPGAKQILCQLTVTNTSGSYSHTEQDERITSAMSATRIEVTDPSVFRDRISITTANGSYTISCAEVSGETAVKISFLKIVDDQQFVTSTEFDTLDNRIGDLDDLETTDQTSMVDAVNEVVGSVSSNTQAIANLNSEISTFKVKDITTVATTATANANGIVWIDEDYRTSIVLGAWASNYPISFGYDTSNNKYFICSMNISNGVMVPRPNSSVSYWYYKLTKA